MRSLFLPLLPLALGACATLPSSRGTELLRSDGSAVPLEAMVSELADADVVFLGEEHDSDGVHALQQEVFEALHAARGGAVVLSMEMFERDAQGPLDLYLSGALTEEEFLARSRPWPNYAEHYRAAIEFAKAEGIPVLAGNAKRALASLVSKEGTAAGQGDPWGPRQVIPMGGRYEELFMEVMSQMAGHGQAMPTARMRRFFEAQCFKDEAMAEAITDHLAAVAPERPLVVHWCGRFHSDFALGTVERVARRRPDLDLVVVSGRKRENGDYDAAGDSDRGDFLWITAR
jgi:uncharacterized iron-regulated protein